jgi:hypothetical protein
MAIAMAQMRKKVAVFILECFSDCFNRFSKDKELLFVCRRRYRIQICFYTWQNPKSNYEFHFNHFRSVAAVVDCERKEG